MPNNREAMRMEVERERVRTRDVGNHQTTLLELPKYNLEYNPEIKERRFRSYMKNKQRE